jgi:hypothetical protein
LGAGAGPGDGVLAQAARPVLHKSIWHKRRRDMAVIWTLWFLLRKHYIG